MNLVKNLKRLNRKRNYLKKDLKYKLSLYMAAKIWRYNPATDISPDGVKSILFIRADGKIGDAIVATYPLRGLYQAGYAVDILAVRATESVFRHNPFIRNLYVVEEISGQGILNHGIPENIVKTLRDNKYDLLFDSAVWQTALYMPKLIYDITPRITMGFNKSGWLKQYNKPVEFDVFCQHTRNIYILLLDWLNVMIDKTFRYEMFYPQKVTDEVVKSNSDVDGKKNVIINIYASHNDRTMSENQLARLIRGLTEVFDDLNIIIMDYKKKLDIVKYRKAKIYYPATLCHAMAIISLSNLVISPDTAVVHISAAYEVPLIAIYQDIPENNKLWSPGYSEGYQIFSEKMIISEDDTLIDKIIAKAINIL